MAPVRVEGVPVNPTVTYRLVIIGLCVFFPPLTGFVIGVVFFCGLWLWFNVLGGERNARRLHQSSTSSPCRC